MLLSDIHAILLFLVLSLCKHVPNAAGDHLRAVAAIAARRLGSTPPLEPTEELRLAVCQVPHV